MVSPSKINAGRISSLQDGRIWYLARIALVAQLVEHLICNQGVAGSNPAGGTKITNKINVLQ